MHAIKRMRKNYNFFIFNYIIIRRSYLSKYQQRCCDINKPKTFAWLLASMNSFTVFQKDPIYIHEKFPLISSSYPLSFLTLQNPRATKCLLLAISTWIRWIFSKFNLIISAAMRIIEFYYTLSIFNTFK